MKTLKLWRGGMNKMDEGGYNYAENMRGGG